MDSTDAASGMNPSRFFFRLHAARDFLPTSYGSPKGVLLSLIRDRYSRQFFPSSIILKARCGHKQSAHYNAVACGLIVFALYIFLMASTSGAVTILEENYHCSGETVSGEIEFGYNLNGFTPVSGSRVDEWGAAFSSAKKFGAKAQTLASSERASATSTFVFVVDSPILIINFTGDVCSTAFPEGKISFLLADYLTHHVIGAQEWQLDDPDPGTYRMDTRWERMINESATFHLIVGNRYQLVLSADVGSADGAGAELNAVLIPEPKAILFVGISTLIAVFRRRRLCHCGVVNH